MPSGYRWVTEQNVMDPIWEPLGYEGVNYYALAARYRARTSRRAAIRTAFLLYQAWLGAYVIAGGKGAFGSGEKETQCSAFCI